jgi:hypothetical protein
MNSIEYMNNSHNESAYIALQPCYRMILNVIYAFSRYSNGLTPFNSAIFSLVLLRVAVATFRYNFITRHELVHRNTLQT